MIYIRNAFLVSFINGFPAVCSSKKALRNFGKCIATLYCISLIGCKRCNWFCFCFLWFYSLCFWKSIHLSNLLSCFLFFCFKCNKLSESLVGHGNSIFC